MSRNKISLYLPKGTKKIRNFLASEIATAKKIKSKDTRDSVVIGLTKILKHIDPTELLHKQGYAYFFDHDEFTVVPYDGIQKLYHCGRSLVLDPFTYLFNSNKYILMALDTNHCTIGILNGKRIQIIWDKEFYIQGKHKKGGSSAARFERLREEQKKAMFKAVAIRLQEVFKVELTPTLPKPMKDTVFKRIRVKEVYNERVKKNS